MLEYHAEKPRFRHFAQQPHMPAIRSDPPLVTYGKRSKPLQLHGRHFLSEPEREPKPKTVLKQAVHERDLPPRRKRGRAIVPQPDDSPLSEDELEAVYNGRDASPIQSATNSPSALQPSKARSERPECQLPRQIRRKRHLPVDELILVASPPSPDRFRQNREGRHAEVDLEQLSDPIAQTTSPSRCLASVAGDSRSQVREAPLTFHRKRLKTPKFTHKSVAALRKKKRAVSVFSRDDCANEYRFDDACGPQRHGDGFDTSEIKSGRSFKMKRRKAVKTLATAFGALQLRAGPLPKVEFRDSSCELKVEAHSSDQNAALEMDDCDAAHRNGASTDPDSEKASRRVAFSDRVFDQLSSISAPRRVYSISSDVSDNEEDYDNSEGEIEEASENGDIENGHDENEAISQEERQLPPQSPKTDKMPPAHNRSPSADDMHCAPKSTGVTLDFRRALAPGIHPRRSSVTKTRLMEVNDMIVDDPFVEQQDTPDLPSDPSLLQRTQAGDGTARRPRSILRNHTPSSVEGTTSMEYTHANTRRNSIITTEDSHYFNAATSMLRRGPDTARETSRRTITQNANDTAASAYFARQRREIHVIDSEAAIPETSPERRPVDYTFGLGMRGLQRSPDARSSSSMALPAVPKDLRSLTRNVSREHGTLSQAVKRRPSLPFQSPTKVGR